MPQKYIGNYYNLSAKCHAFYFLAPPILMSSLGITLQTVYAEKIHAKLALRRDSTTSMCGSYHFKKKVVFKVVIKLHEIKLSAARLGFCVDC